MPKTEDKVFFRVNGNEVNGAKRENLLFFLREKLALTSVKNGCAEGACGSCTVMVNDVAKNGCMLRLEKLAGADVTTIEGLSERERTAFKNAFIRAGAVQCGFCIPGMMISGAALLRKNPDPDRLQVAAVINRNICRCTGYHSIIAAILSAACYLRGEQPPPEIYDASPDGGIDSGLPRPDAPAKILGSGIFVDDIRIDGMLYGGAVRSRYPRALIRKIDYAKALAHPDCVSVVTAADIPGLNKTGHIVADWDVLIAEGEHSRYVGDALALVAVSKLQSLEEVIGLVEVDYQPLPPLCSPAEALAAGAPPLHPNGNVLSEQRLRRGNAVEEVFSRSAHIVSRKYSLPFTEHAFMEPECAIAMPDGAAGLRLYTAGQNIYDEQREIAPVLAIAPEKITIESKLVGGGFGGKEDMSVQHHAALLAYLLKKTVKVKLGRQESINVHPKRHAMEIEMTTACDENGRLTATRAKIVSDTGAYASLGGPVLQRACTHAAGPYNYQNIDIHGIAAYTNNPPAGAFRGFGVSQSCFAIECNLDLLAEKAGISPFEIRYRNAVKPGDTLPNGQIADCSTALCECLDKLRPVFASSPYVGIAAAFKNSGLGVGVTDIGRCIVSVERGKIHLRSGAARIGQGLDSVVAQIACQTLALPPSLLLIEPPATNRTPNSGTTTASRQTVFTGEAVRRACVMLKEQLDGGKTLDDLEGQEFAAEYHGITDPMGSPKANPVSHVAYGYAAQLVVLDAQGHIVKVVAAHDVGQAINRQNIIGQIEGGVVMGLGYALTEDFPLKDAVPQAKYGTLGLWRAQKVPPIESFIIEKEQKLPIAYGAKGIGEIATIPTAPAVHNAYYSLDGKFRAELPLSDTPYGRQNRK